MSGESQFSASNSILSSDTQQVLKINPPPPPRQFICQQDLNWNQPFVLIYSKYLQVFLTVMLICLIVQVAPHQTVGIM